MKTIYASQFPAGREEFQRQLDRYLGERGAHKNTVNVPAPSAHYLVEDVANNNGGQFTWVDDVQSEVAS